MISSAKEARRISSISAEKQESDREKDARHFMFKQKKTCEVRCRLNFLRRLGTTLTTFSWLRLKCETHFQSFTYCRHYTACVLVPEMREVPCHSDPQEAVQAKWHKIMDWLYFLKKMKEKNLLKKKKSSKKITSRGTIVVIWLAWTCTFACYAY